MLRNLSIVSEPMWLKSRTIERKFESLGEMSWEWKRIVQWMTEWLTCEAFLHIIRFDELIGQITSTQINYIEFRKVFNHFYDNFDEVIAKRIETQIRFVRPMAMVADVTMVTETISDNQTKVSLINSGTLKYPMNIFIPMAEKNFPKDMDTSLKTLKELLEKDVQ